MFLYFSIHLFCPRSPRQAFLVTHGERLFRIVAALLIMEGAASPLRAEVSVSRLFSDHAVLQADEKVPVWGWAAPQETIKVTLGKASASAIAGADGKWQANLDLREVGAGPFDLIVEGSNRLVSSDVLVGQVWLCSGQSNMQWPLSGSGGAAEEIPRSANPQLRHFKVETAAAATPAADVQGSWVVATPETTPEFSAIAYYFGQALQRDLQVPVGLINATWGGTPTEAWAGREAYEDDADLQAGAEKARADAAHNKGFLEKYRQWTEQNNREDAAPAVPEDFADSSLEGAGWKPVQLPGSLAEAGFSEAGVVWIARSITLPESAVGSPLQIWFGEPKDSVTLYWNGLRFGQGGLETTIYRYALNQKHVTATENVLLARLVNPTGPPALEVPPGIRFRLDYKGGGVQLAGEWMAKAESAFPPLAPGTPSFPVKPPMPRPDYEVASYLFDGMIHPLIPMAIAGVAYNHGSANSERAWQYRKSFPRLISNWRKQWGRGDFPFYFCQLYNFQPQPATPGHSTWAELREGQTMALALPNTGMAALIDAGEAGNIHPADKKTPGDRLARIALHKSYGKNVVASGPMFDSSSIEDGKVRVKFRSTEGGLVTQPVKFSVPRPESAVQGFAICGEDKKWVWAQAEIDGTDVKVWSPEVPHPVAVRYGWADNPVVNLYNKEGLPASPFRTDDFALPSANKKY